MVELCFNIFLNIVILAFAMWMGGVATTIYCRLPNNISIGPSHKPTCDTCGSRITLKYFFPIIGYVLSKGKCINCKQRIPRVYLYMEILITILIMILASQVDFYKHEFLTEAFVSKAILVAYLTTLLFMKCTSKKIVTSVVWITLVLFLLYSGYNNTMPDLIELFFSVIASYAIVAMLSKIEFLEQNDIALYIILLSWTGQVIPLICFAISLIYATIRRLLGRKWKPLISKSTTFSRICINDCLIIMPTLVNMLQLLFGIK